ncbi:MAG: hypothetical protein A3J59_03225 [Candidatus Buchananbacteria bacterium RIFCSPHIGHO2_02_FULL_56_16]|uniref:Glutamyl-tRNA amidotransferase n=1 Tax=Candidatus Buchananbacteria bacterium RIFCSPHIGHO2_02_FULL_56_16 TaxID=1797542 RepID=A0A1G1YGI4_9BACT|nr:MAG: hypothetical protein A3J59_03225 [Candidatus Buchananbacteria bacterium RIFCSPHIGHO2_02_FULL_56_16]
MSILDTLDQDISQSLRAKDELALLTFRQTKTALQNAEIANGRKPLSDEQVQKVLRSEVKKRRDAIELYQRGGRPELAEKEQREIELVSRYLPPELSEATIRSAVKAAIERLGATSPKEMGAVIGAAMTELKGAADGGAVSRIVKEELGST